jgi:hypothetical protein
VQDGSADITSATYLSFAASPEFSLQDVAINQVSIAVNPLPAALPLFVTGLGAMCLLFWLRNGNL